MLTPSSARDSAWTFASVVSAAKLPRLLSSRQGLSWFDQGLVSGTSFVTLLLLARWTEPTALGAFAVAMSIVAMLLASHEALVVRPYTIRLHGPTDDAATRPPEALWLSVSLCVIFAAALFAALVVSIGVGFSAGMQHVLLALALSGPCLVLRELARKQAYARLQVKTAVMVSLPACVLTLIALALLRWSGMLTAASAIGAMGIASGLSALLWLRGDACQFIPLAPAWRRSWTLGKWFLAAQIGIQAQAYSTIWLTLMMGGAAMAGVYAACASIVAIANPLLLGFSNLLIPQSSQVLHEGGIARLQQQTVRAALQLGAVIGIPCLAIAASGDRLMSLLYPADYQGQGWVLAALAFATWSAALGIPASIALAALQRPGVVAVVVGLTAILNLALLVVLLPAFGLPGAALGMLIAETAGSAGRWAAFYLVVKSIPDRMASETR